MSIIDIFLKRWLRSGRYRWSRLHRRLFERKYLKFTLPAVSSLEEIEVALNQITWTPDGLSYLFDCVSYPQVTWYKKRDDCDGFSTLAAALLNQWNPDCHPVLVTAMLRPFGSSHTICVFTSPSNKLCFFDNSTLLCDNYPSYESIIKKISNNAIRLVCWDIINPITLEIIEFNTG